MIRWSWKSSPDPIEALRARLVLVHEFLAVLFEVRDQGDEWAWLCWALVSTVACDPHLVVLRLGILRKLHWDVPFHEDRCEEGSSCAGG